MDLPEETFHGKRSSLFCKASEAKKKSFITLTPDEKDEFAF